MNQSNRQPIETLCPFCGVGCGMGLHVAGGRVTGVEPVLAHPVSRGQLCAKGWNTPFGIDPDRRILTPLIKTGRTKHPQWHPVEWDEALQLVTDRFQRAMSHFGGDSVGVISSARATNEDNYAAQKLARTVFGTNNIDHCARICYSPSVAGLNRTLGSDVMTNSIADIGRAELVVVFGADPTENHPILGGQIIRAKSDGARLMVVDPRRTRLAAMADIHLQPRLGSNVALINGMLHIIFRHGWENRLFLQRRCGDTTDLERTVADYTPSKVSEITGISEPKLFEAARLYTRAGKAFLAYGMGITQFTNGTDNVIALSNLVLTCGHIGRPGTGINPLRGQNNVQGACDMGCLPNVYPDYQPVDDPGVRHKFSTAWRLPVPASPGLTSQGMIDRARRGKFKCLLLFGEDPVTTNPDQSRVLEGLNALDCLVVVEMHMTDTARHGDIILPAASFAEKEGTFTNCERRVQRVRRALSPPGNSREDWRIAADIAACMGHPQGFDWHDSEQIFDEMAALTHSFSGMDYAGLDRHRGLQWPCNSEYPTGCTYLHGESFPIGKARLIPVHHRTSTTPTRARTALPACERRL